MAEDDDVTKLHLKGIDLGRAVDEAADGEAKHADLTLEADGLDIFQATQLAGAEEVGVQAVFEGVGVAGLPAAVASRATRRIFRNGFMGGDAEAASGSKHPEV